MNIQVLKINGEKEEFSHKKVFESAKRSGAGTKDAKDIADYVQSIIYDGIKTVEIYKVVRKRLSSKHKMKFSLKNTMRRLGEDGFYFERYLGRILEELGYRVKINQYLKGASKIRYEIDFVAYKEDTIYLGECKYRWKSMDKIDLKTALYNYARYLDIADYNKKKITPMLATNYKLTSLAKKYCLHKGVEVLSWSFPEKYCLRKIIEEKKLYPINILPGFDKVLAPVFLENNIILVSDLFLCKKLERVVSDKKKREKLLYEGKVLLNI